MVAELDRAGWPAYLVDSGNRGDDAAVLAAVSRSSPSLVVLSQHFAHLLPWHLALTGSVRQAGCWAHLTLAGDLPGMAAEELLAAVPALDSVLPGGHEHVLPLLAAAAESGGGWAGVPGLIWRDATIRTNPSPQPPDLNTRPWPAYPDGLPKWMGVPFCTVEASRGCWHRCAFCLPCAAGRHLGWPYALRSVSSLCDEMAARCSAGARLFLFDDEQFLPPDATRFRRVDDLRAAIERRGLHVAFTLKARPDDADPRLFAALKDAGLIRVYLGVESTCQGVLDHFRKDLAAVRHRRALSVLGSLGLVVDLRLLLFHPWSTVATVRAEVQALRGLLDLLPTSLDVREVEVYPGTPLAHDLAAEGRPVPVLDPLGYAIPDAGAEWLRRMSRLVFGSCAPYQRLRERLTLNWFGALLRERGLAAGTGPARAAIRPAVRTMNDSVLDTWDALLSAAATGPLTADRSQEMAASLSAPLAAACAAAAP